MVTIDQLVNILAEKILSNTSSHDGHDHHVQEVLTIFPSLQFGMDVNPKFTAGPTGVEYTMHLNAFDLLHIELLHGWLIEPDAEEYDLIGNQTYNQLVNMVIEGNDAATALQNATLTHHDGVPISPEHDALSTKATKGSIVKHFLDRSSHQLTQYGLTVLHEYLQNGQMVVFFRNNHFNTMTKHDGLLYLLVTDIGYANVPNVVFEKIDVIDGDTEYVDGTFGCLRGQQGMTGGSAEATSEPMGGANDLQSQADYQLALQLSQENSSYQPGLPRPGTATPSNFNDEIEAARQASLEEYNRQHPDAPLPITSTPPTATKNTTTPRTRDVSSQFRSSFEQRVNQLTETMRQAGTSITEVANSIIQPAPPLERNTTATATATTATRASTGTLPSRTNATSAANNNPSLSPQRQSKPQISAAVAATSPQTRSPVRETVVTGVPARPPSQEQQDRMLAMQIQQQEERERGSGDSRLAVAMARKERERAKKHASRPGPPPERLAIAPPTSRNSANKDNCVIS